MHLCSNQVKIVIIIRNGNRIVKQSWDPEMTVGHLIKSNSSVSFHISLCINMTLKRRIFPDSIT